MKKIRLLIPLLCIVLLASISWGVLYGQSHTYAYDKTEENSIEKPESQSANPNANDSDGTYVEISDDKENTYSETSDDTEGTDIDLNRPMVALTFDDGPSQVTPRILELLQQYDGRATFFVLGNRLDAHAQIARDIVLQGSELMNHSWSHRWMTRISEDEVRQELQNTSDAIYALTGIRSAGFRPPYNASSDLVRDISSETGHSIIRWSVDSRDWESRNANAIYNEIMSNITNGDIVVLHDIHESTAEAMALVIPELHSRGYQMVTVSELLTSSGRDMEPGAIYHSYDDRR